MASIIYSDISTNFSIHPIKGDLVLLTNEDAVKRSIRNLLFTDVFERPFSPDLGGSINQLLFENINRDTEWIMREKITDVITNFEPRAELINVLVKALPDENAFSIVITFAVIDNIVPVILNLVLRRVR